MKNPRKSHKSTFPAGAASLSGRRFVRDRIRAIGAYEKYEKFYRTHFSTVYQYLWRRLGRNRETAEDITQEAFVRMLELLPILNRRSLKSHLFDTAERLLEEYRYTPRPLPL